MKKEDKIKKKRIFIYGIGTYKNRGVEAIINSTLNQIDLNKYEIVVATYNYDYNKKFYTEKIKKYINHYKEKKDFTQKELAEYEQLKKSNSSRRKIELFHEKQLIEEIKKADICISAGGDNYCYGVSDWLYAIDEIVRKESKNLIFFGGSLYENLEKQDELVSDMDLFDILLIREKPSYQALAKYIDKNKLLLGPDPAFSLKAKKTKLNSWYKGRKVVGINVSPLTIPNAIDKDERFESVVLLINYILNKTDYSVSLIPHVTTEGCNDLDTLSSIYEKFKTEERVFLESDQYNCREIKYLISKCEIMIAARTHASIAAYSSLIPTLVIGYSVKSKGIAQDLFNTDKNYVIQKEDLKGNNLINAFSWIDKNKKAIKKNLSEKMDNRIYDAEHLFERVIQKLNDNNKNVICRKQSCIGCGICENICPTHAITMKKDQLGFQYPIINKEKCIECNACRSVCPINKLSTLNTFKPITYAIKNKNDNVRTQSTSGGIFTLLAEKVLSKKGVVYGAATINNKVTHIRIDHKKDLYQIRGSKYAQSSLLEILNNIKEDIKNNKQILFSGTPCQIGAVKSLVKNNDNIIYVSVICHGVINDYLKEIYFNEQYPNEKIKSFDYRTKDNGWDIASIKAETETNTYIKKFSEDVLMGLFNQNIILRESCYNCKYKGESNPADIIIGDYWGIQDIHPKIFDKLGVSSLIINTLRGKEFIGKNHILEYTEYIKSNIKHIKRCNPAYQISPIKPLSRFIIKETIPKGNLSLIYEYEKGKQEIAKLKEKLMDLEQLKDQEIKSLEEEVYKIKNSTRWKITDKLFNIANRILKRK